MTAIRSGWSRFLRTPSERRAAVPTVWAGAFSRSASASFHLSFADAIIAAVARLHEAVLVHKDPEFETLADEISLLNLPYK
jgi:predicted nucleic acid-binding protein